MDYLQLRTASGITFEVPARLDCITTYVLLEQEAWFEKELIFLRAWLRAGMTVLDIGANVGIYAIEMARRVAPGGRVFAFEPGREARASLARNCGLNGVTNVTISPAAVSDSRRTGQLVLGRSSELAALGVPGADPGHAAEMVQVTSLDAEDATGQWRSPDFVKIDAEGEEQRILAGGAAFFAHHSPLVMFEARAGDTWNIDLLVTFRNLGYSIYHMPHGAPLLVRVVAADTAATTELNLFAAKPERAAKLAREGWLVDELLAWQSDEASEREALALPARQPFAADFVAAFSPSATVERQLLEGLAAYAAWRDAGRAPAVRFAALGYAVHALRELCVHAPAPCRLSTLARFTWEFGARTESVQVLERLTTMLRDGSERFLEPFWPPAPRCDQLSTAGRPQAWLYACAAEQFERIWSASSLFSGPSSLLTTWLWEQPYSSIEMERRRVLRDALTGQQPQVPERLQHAAPDHLNAGIWRAGRVPGTVVDP